MAYYYQGNGGNKGYNYGGGDTLQHGDTQIAMPNQGGMETKPNWNWCAHGWSMFAIFCCPWFAMLSTICAAGGLVCSISAYSDHKAGDYMAARYKKACAIAWTVIAILFGAAVLAVAIYFIYDSKNDLLDWWKDFSLTPVL